MSRLSGLRYPRILVVCHGDSECILCKSLRSNLRLPMIFSAKNKGRNSIQVTSVRDYLSTGTFESHKRLLAQYSEIEHSKREATGITIYPIMDLDDCEPHQARDYRSGKLFDGTPFRDLIVPIFNTPNLDSVLISAGIQIDPKDKSRSYRRCFPGDNGNLDSAKNLHELLKSHSGTNMEVLIAHCIEVAEKNQFLNN